MPKVLIGISILLLTFSVLIGFLSTSKVKGLRNELVTATSAREVADRSRLASEKRLKAHDTDLTAAASKATAAEAKASSAEAELTKAQNNKAELESKLQASEGQIADLQKRVTDATVAVSGVPEGMSPNELKALLDDTKH
jgi:chromosome segregation ATPase